MKAILFAAKSTADEKGSIKDQLKDGRKLAAELGHEAVYEDHDEDASAFHGNRGPGLARVLAECERHAPCVLIVQRSDRLARGDTKQARSLVQIVLWAIEHDVELLSVQDPAAFPATADPHMKLILGGIAGMSGHQESEKRSQSVKKGMARAKAEGKFLGRVPLGCIKVDGKLAESPSTGTVVRSIFTDYAAGVSARELSRTHGLHRSAVNRILGNPTYRGTVVDSGLFDRVQAIRSQHLRPPGRNPDGGHLFVKGLLRTPCGAAYKPMRARPGHRATYVCSAREAGSGCGCPSIRRELVDEPLLRLLLDRYVDLDAMRQRIAERANTALADARRVFTDRQAEVAKLERAMGETERAFDAGTINDRQYAKRETRLTEELAGARAALEQAEVNAASTQHQPAGGDPEQELLDHLAALKAAVADGVAKAPNLNALRNVLAELFERVQLINGNDLSPLIGTSVLHWADGWEDYPADGLWLLPVLRGELDDDLNPAPVELPTAGTVLNT